MKEELYLELKKYLSQDSILNDDFYKRIKLGFVQKVEIDLKIIELEKLKGQVFSQMKANINRTNDPFWPSLTIQRSLSKNDLNQFRIKQSEYQSLINHYGDKSKIPTEKLSDDLEFVSNCHLSFDKISFQIPYETGLNGFFEDILNNITEHISKLSTLKTIETNKNSNSIIDYLFREDEIIMLRDNYLIIRKIKDLFALLSNKFLNGDKILKNTQLVEGFVINYREKIIMNHQFINIGTVKMMISKSFEIDKSYLFKNNKKSSVENAIITFDEFISLIS